MFAGAAQASEQVLARRLLASLAPGMLLLADRNFAGHELWGLVTAAGADMAWRIKKNLVFPPVKVLPDGSFHSVSAPPPRTSATGVRPALPPGGSRPVRLSQGHLVRIIEYTGVTVDDSSGGARTEEPFQRLVTTLLDHEQAPAAQVAASYHQRWEAENGYAELKTRLRGAAFILRSPSHELVCQELFAFLTVNQALCALKTEAARTAGIDPDRISFPVTVRVDRDHASNQVSVTTPGLSRDTRSGQAIRKDILDDLLPRRRDRQCQRVKKPPKNTFPAKKRAQARPPGKVNYKITVTRKATSPAGTP